MSNITPEIMETILIISDGDPQAAVRCVQLFVVYGKGDLEVLIKSQLRGVMLSEVFNDDCRGNLEMFHEYLNSKE